ncbi:TlpA family protein disulfide reductase [bacterium]|nr:MAG: TlpA family protein disulfide reductase [bacterium]
MTMSPRASFRLAAAVFLAACLLLSGFPARAADYPKTLPEIRLSDWDGKEYVITRNGDGGNVLIFFWSVFCPNCKEVMPKLAKYASSEASRGTKFYAVNVDGENFKNAVKAFLDDVRPGYTVVLDRFEKGAMVAADPLNVAKTPTLYLVTSTGKVILRQEISIDLDRFEKANSAKK